MALCAAAGVAKADLAWDGVVQVPGTAGQYPGQYLVCPQGTHLDFRSLSKCEEGLWAPKAIGAPKLMSLQQALDMHFKMPAGLKAVAQGPMQSFTRYGLDRTQFGIAYKLEKQ
jgi:hypothetical protein